MSEHLTLCELTYCHSAVNHISYILIDRSTLFTDGCVCPYSTEGLIWKTLKAMGNKVIFDRAGVLSWSS